MRTRSGQPAQVFHPERIGPYEVLRRLGAGAMGEVFLARSPSARLVAVKTIRPGLAEHPGYRRRFAHEVDSARRVSGAFTAAVVDADPHADLPWLATVYVPAPSLEELVAECGPQTVSAVRWLAAGCAEALEGVHRAGLVHRDFKPANVLVTADGPRVIDFGLARSDGLPQGTAAGMVLGTPLYMAPEQAAGDPVVGPAADVFALGATLYHAATGSALYQEEKAVGVLLQKMRQPPELAPVPRDLRGLIAECLDLEPENRPTPTELVAELAPFLATADASRPLPEAVLRYIENYRGTQMELTRSRKSLPEADTEVIGEPTHVAVRTGDLNELADFGDGSRRSRRLRGSTGSPDAEGSGRAGTAGSDGSHGSHGSHGSDGSDGFEDDDPRPRHPSLLPGRVPANRRRPRDVRGYRVWFGRRKPMGPTAIAVGVVIAFGAATVSALFLAGVVTLGSKHSGQPSAAGLGAGASVPSVAGSLPGSPPPTNSQPPPSRGFPPPGGPGGMGGPPPSPPPGAVTVIDGTRLSVRPPFGDPQTTFILDGVGWPAGQTVTVTFLNGAVPPATTIVDGSGTFSVGLNQGAGRVVLLDGRYHVRASSGSRSESVSFVIGPPLDQ